MIFCGRNKSKTIVGVQTLATSEIYVFVDDTEFDTSHLWHFIAKFGDKMAKVRYIERDIKNKT